jgi:hypothetical protein
LRFVDCRRYIRANPDADLDEISKATGVSAKEITESGEFGTEGKSMPAR